jgi:glycosyltransferase involved in cell wall biosynthesis
VPAPDRLRVAVLSELPTPYRWPLFVKVAQAGPVDLTVLYYAATEADRDWGMRAESQPGGPVVEVLPGRAYAVRGRRSLFFHWNPGIAKRLRDGAFDVVVLPGWSMPTTLRAWVHCRRHGTPYVVFSETNDRSPRPAWLRFLKRAALRPVVGGASAWLATGSLSAAFLARHGADPARTFRFANTPDVAALRAAVDEARPGRDAFRASLTTPADAVVTLFVGRLIGAKDPRSLLDAQTILERDGAAPWLWIAGDGPESKVLRDLAAERKLGHVRFLGPRRPSELPAVWAAADLFCLPSLHEPWGVVVNEAMAARLPVVLSDRVGAAADLLVDGRNGRVVPPSDPAALAAAIRGIAGDADLRAAMSRASSEIIAGWDHGPSVEGFLAAVAAAAGRSR